jgi:hypothetical protein
VLNVTLCSTAAADAVNMLGERQIEDKNFNGLATKTSFIDFMYACLCFISILPTLRVLICLVSRSVEWKEDFDQARH